MKARLDPAASWLIFVLVAVLSLLPCAGVAISPTTSAIHKYPHPNPLQEGEGASGSGPLKNAKPITNRCTSFGEHSEGALGQRGPHLVQSLPNESAGANAGISRDDSALIDAVANGDLETAKMLLAKGIDVNSKAKDGTTALMRAIGNGDLEMTKLLLSKGADVNTEANDGSTPLMWAAVARNPETVKILRESGAEMTIHIAALLGDTEEVRRFLDTGIAANAEFKDGRTVLMCASERGHIDVIRLLLKHGANPNLNQPHGWSPLALAVRNGHVEAVKTLLENGANVDQTAGPLTMLQLASSGGHTDIVELLKKHGLSGQETEVFTGEIVASAPKKLTIKVQDETSTRVIEARIGLKTRFVPFRRPAVGEKVEIVCRGEKGGIFATSVKVIIPKARE